MSWDALPEDVKEYAIRELTQLQLDVVMAHTDNHSFREIGLAMNRDEATIRGHWDRALRRMKPFYDEIRKAAA